MKRNLVKLPYPEGPDYDDEPNSGMPQRRRRRHALNDLDVVILQWLTRLGTVRPHHLVQVTGAAPSTVQKRLGLLRAAELADQLEVPVNLVRGDKVHASRCSVWIPTARGTRLAGTWAAAGYPGRVQIGPPSRRAEHLQHTLGVADLAGWAVAFGIDVAVEREIRSLECRVAGKKRSLLTHGQQWAVNIPGRPDVHPPDLGFILPDGTRWAIELERATKTVPEYMDVIGAYQASGLGQVWFTPSRATGTLLLEACARLGMQWAASPPQGVHVSLDRKFRLQGWRPGRSGLADPKTWKNQLPGVAPAGFGLPLADPAIRRGAWEPGREVDLADQDGLDLGGWMVAA